MVPKKKIDEILDGYDPSKITIATLCSHSSLQIFHGARKMGFKTIGLVTKNNQRIYDAFPLAKPDKFITYSDYDDMSERAGELQDENAVIIPHGSFVEYMGAKAFEDFEVPSYGNRGVLSWESDRVLQRQWITSAGAPMPRLITDAREIKEPVMVKYHGAKGGRGFFIAKDYPDFKMGIDNTQPYTIQEYCLGTRYYLHFFYDPLKTDGYRIKQGGSLELLSIDRRDESNIDEMYKLGSLEDAKRHGLYPSFVVTGNTPVVIRESLLPRGKGAIIVVNKWDKVEKNDKTIYKFQEDIRKTLSFIPYAEMIYPGFSTGARMAMEIRDAIAADRLKELMS